jgi:hypothetical protein
MNFCKHIGPSPDPAQAGVTCTGLPYCHHFIAKCHQYKIDLKNKTQCFCSHETCTIVVDCRIIGQYWTFVSHVHTFELVDMGERL